MPITASALRELHRYHRQMTDLRDRLQRGPKMVEAGESTVGRLEQEHSQMKEGLTKARVACDDKQLQLKDRESRIEDLKRKLNTCSSNREYQTLREQIAADQQANNVLADEILEAMDAIDKLQEELKESEANLASAQEKLNSRKSQTEQQQGELEAELERVAAGLKQAEGALPSDFRSDYLRITKARGEDALAPVVEGECCGSCYCTLSPQTMNELYLAKPVFCKSCGCLLYLNEGQSPKEREGEAADAE